VLKKKNSPNLHVFCALSEQKAYGLFFFVVCVCYRTAGCHHSQWNTLSIIPMATLLSPGNKTVPGRLPPRTLYWASETKLLPSTSSALTPTD